MKPSDWSSIIHSVERRNLINTHRWHLQDPRDLVHDADACEAMLSLSQIKQGHHRRLLVLARVSAQDLLDELLVDRVEFERNRRVVDVGVSVL